MTTEPSELEKALDEWAKPHFGDSPQSEWNCCAKDKLMSLIETQIEIAVLEGKIDMISWALSRTSMDELKTRWYELEAELKTLRGKTDD